MENTLCCTLDSLACFSEKHIELSASSRLYCGGIYSTGRLHWNENKLVRDNIYLNNANLAAIWAVTIALMNCTFNCLIFYWKNKVLRTEGLELLKSLKICRRVES